MKSFILGSIFFLSQLSFAADFEINGITASNKFVEHTDNTAFGSWLGLNLSFGPFDQLRKDVEVVIKNKLLNRGEAHITVITPPEFDKILKAHLKIEDINQIAQSAKIQTIKWSTECVGTASAVIDNKTETTYFVVVNSPELLNLRMKIKEAFVRNGGNAKDFRAEKYQPHITLGYTKRDLHEDDGVSKDKISCWKSL